MKFNFILFWLIIFSFFLFSCKKTEQIGTIEINFAHTIDMKPLELNNFNYKNAADNMYMVSDVKYFISKIVFVNSEGEKIIVNQNQGVHYVDVSLFNTLRMKIDNIPQGHYYQVEFIFGLAENDNKSNRFVNPPESNFAWPDYLGGGYHYMQINGKYWSEFSLLQNLNIHTGIGQIYDANNEITEFVPNYVHVTLPLHFFVNAENVLPLTINMEINNWFQSPNTFDFNEFGSGIMQNQQAQQYLKENAIDVFTIKQL